MSTHADPRTCPRCGERLPEGLTRCDACGAYLSSEPEHAHARPEKPGPSRSPAPAPHRGRSGGVPVRPTRAQGVPGSAWMLLVVGLLCGGAIGYTLRGAVGPREEGGAPTGPSDVMSGMGGNGAPAQMPPEVSAKVQEYQRTLAFNPDDVDANIGMGNLLYDSGKWDRAVHHYQRALVKAPDKADVRVDMAVAYHQLGQNDRAREEMERVTREHPEHRNAWLNLGVVSAHMGDRAGAIRAWEQYLKLEPDGQHSAAIRAQIEELKRPS